jgi:hypothetical protein
MLMKSSPTAKQRSEWFDWIIEQLSLVALAKGQTYSPERLRINAEDLSDLPREALASAFHRARRELNFMPQVSEIRRLAGADPATQLDGEKRAAWDVLIKFVEKYVGCDAEEHFGPEYGSHSAFGPYDDHGVPKHPATYPQLPPRILDCVRRTGGWKQYKRMTEDDHPFQQKRFFEEYENWEATEISLPTLAACLQIPEAKIKLLAKPMDAPRRTPPPDGAHAKLQIVSGRNARPSLNIPTIQLTPEQITARRAEELAEIEKYKEAK